MLKAIITTLSILFFYTISIFSQCAITDLVLTPSDCDNDGNYDLTINFNTQNPGNTFFDLSINGELYEFFPLADLPITIENFPDGGLTVPFVTVCINDNPDCCFENEFPAPDCNINDCELNITVIEAHDCDADGNFLVDFEIEYSGQGNEGFTVFGNGMNYGNFVYGETFYTVGPFAGNGTSVYEIIIQDLEVADCQTFTGFNAPDCGGNEDCQITNTFIEYQPCNGDGQFFLHVGVEVENPVSSTFNILGNGQNYGNFPYGQSFYEIGPFEGNPSAVYELIFVDEDNLDCQTEVVFEGVDCGVGGDCVISDMELTPSDCDDDGNYDLTINFIAQNPNNAFFDLFINGELYEFYSLADLPITIENFPDGGLTVPFVTVCINDNPDCCFENEFVAPDCDNNDCEIDITAIELHDCDDDGNFLVDFAIAYSGQGDEGFTIFGNGTNYGNFEYGQTFYTVGPFAGNGNSVEIIIQDLEVADCQTFTGFNAPDCGGPNLVWPGDLNNDNIANNLDLLNLGLAFNSTGEPRDMQGIEWSAMPATEWDFSFANGVNYVFADANGDGTADANDQNAIEINYDLTHGDVVENYDETGDETDPELFVDLPNADLITIGEPFTAPIILGTNDIPVGNIYGLAFTLVFDPTIIDPENVEIEFFTNWMGQSGVNVLTLAEKLAIGEVDMVLTKNDQNNVGGFGQIAAFIGIIDNIAGKTEIEIQIKDVRAINRGEETVFLQRPVDMIEVTVSTSHQLTNNGISIYPNPTMDELIIANTQHLPITAVEIRNASGKLVAIFENGDKKMDVSSLPSGVYLLKFEIGGRMYFERFIKM